MSWGDFFFFFLLLRKWRFGWRKRRLLCGSAPRVYKAAVVALWYGMLYYTVNYYYAIKLMDFSFFFYFKKTDRNNKKWFNCIEIIIIIISYNILMSSFEFYCVALRNQSRFYIIRHSYTILGIFIYFFPTLFIVGTISNRVSFFFVWWIEFESRKKIQLHSN